MKTNQNTFQTPANLWNRNFTMVVIGQIISIFGNTILRFALNVYVLQLTGSAAIFGTVSALSMIPTVLLSPVGGMLADRFNRRNIMVVLDFATAALVLAFGLALREAWAVPLIAAVLMVLAVIQSFYNPAVQSSVPLLQSGENLVRGNAVVNQVAMLANLVGPVLGGVLYAAVGIAPIIFVSAICFFLSAVLEIFIFIPFQAQEHIGGALKTVKSDFSQSMRFITKEQPAILRGLLIVAAFNLFISSMMMLGSNYFIITLLNLDTNMLGYAQGAMAVGGLLGGLLAGVLAAKIRIRSIHWLLVATPFTVLPIAYAFMAGLPAFATYIILVASLTLFNVLAAMFSIFALSAIQQRTPGHLLGKVYGLVMAVCMAAQPVGQLLYGFLFQALPAQLALVMLATAAITLLIGLSAGPSFGRLEAGALADEEDNKPAAPAPSEA